MILQKPPDQLEVRRSKGRLSPVAIYRDFVSNGPTRPEHWYVWAQSYLLKENMSGMWILSILNGVFKEATEDSSSIFFHPVVTMRYVPCCTHNRISKLQLSWVCHHSEGL